MSLYRFINCLNTGESQDYRGASVLLMVIFMRQLQTRIHFFRSIRSLFYFFGWFCASPILKKLKPSEIDALTI